MNMYILRLEKGKPDYYTTYTFSIVQSQIKSTVSYFDVCAVENNFCSYHCVLQTKYKYSL